MEVMLIKLCLGKYSTNIQAKAINNTGAVTNKGDTERVLLELFEVAGVDIRTAGVLACLRMGASPLVKAMNLMPLLSWFWRHPVVRRYARFSGTLIGGYAGKRSIF
ncbi:MAG: hypothetical protein PHO15_05930 [Eubacteriales bacterium]|nr:hypothetical protein [Eubacteriales bacterium]